MERPGFPGRFFNIYQNNLFLEFLGGEAAQKHPK
jgi:hypothetical protein